MKEDNLKIAAVVVTFNRLELLKECIRGIRIQTRSLDEIIVVNNGSNDGTLDWLDQQNDLTVITQENSGSAGGQYTGIRTAYEKGYDWIWCMDDDSLSDSMSLSILVTFIEQIKDSQIGFLYPKVIWKDGELHLMNLPGMFSGKRWNPVKIMHNEIIKIDVGSFVGILFNSKAIETVGLPKRELFIWYDDLEYTFRFKVYNNYFISNATILHHTDANAGVDLFHFEYPLNIKNKYGLRNFFYFYSRQNIFYAFITFTKLISKIIFKPLESYKLNKIRSLIKYTKMGIVGDLKIIP